MLRVETILIKLDICKIHQDDSVLTFSLNINKCIFSASYQHNSKLCTRTNAPGGKSDYCVLQILRCIVSPCPRCHIFLLKSVLYLDFLQLVDNIQ